MSFLKKLFGGGDGGSAPEVEPVDYNGFQIYAEPINEGSVYRVAARIEKDIDGQRCTQQMVRADTLNSVDTAAEMSLNKARQVIDERGERLFDGSNA